MGIIMYEYHLSLKKLYLCILIQRTVHRISSLLIIDLVLLLNLRRLAAECEANGVKISISKHLHGSRPEKSGLPSPGRWSVLAASEGV